MMAAPDPSWVSGWKTHGLISKLAGSTGFLADSLYSLFTCNPVNNPSEPAVIGMVDEAMQPYSFCSQKITNLEEVQDAILGLKAAELPGPNGIPNGAVKHLPPIVSLLDKFINVIFLTQYFPRTWKHAHVFHPETWEGPGAAILSTHKCVTRNWQTM